MKQTVAVAPMDSMPQAQEKVDDFFTLRYNSLSRWCHSRWNGQGGDVMNSAYEIAKKRGYTHITFALFASLCLEAARNMGIHRWIQDNEKTIILPPTELAAERLEAHLATAPADDPPQYPTDCTRAARKLIRAEARNGQMNFWSEVAQ